MIVAYKIWHVRRRGLSAAEASEGVPQGSQAIHWGGLRRRFVALLLCCEMRTRTIVPYSIAIVTFLLLCAWQLRGHMSMPSSLPQTHTQIEDQTLPSEVLSDQGIPDPNVFEPELFELEGPFDGAAIGQLCDSIKWRSGLYFECSNNSGGLGNMRSFILNCIRYAIEAGAGLVMPTIRKRNPANLGDLFSNVNERLGYMFDEDFFRDAMQTYCPQMVIIQE